MKKSLFTARRRERGLLIGWLGWAAYAVPYAVIMEIDEHAHH